MGVLDVVIFLLILLTVLSLWQRENLRLMFERPQEEKAYAVTVSLKEPNEESIALLTEGTTLYVTDGDGARRMLGTLSDEVEVATLAEGELAVCGTVSCRGVWREGKLLLSGGDTLLIGAEYAVSTDKGEYTLVVLSFTELP